MNYCHFYIQHVLLSLCKQIEILRSLAAFTHRKNLKKKCNRNKNTFIFTEINENNSQLGEQTQKPRKPRKYGCCSNYSDI